MFGRKKEKKTKPSAKPAAKPGRARRRPRRGTLMLIAALLVGSAILRVGPQAGRLYALDAAQGAEAATAAAACEPPPDLAATLDAFKTRETQLDERERQVRDRMHALAVADEEIQKKIVRLQEAEKKLADTIALADGAAENDLARLTAVYESMKPKDASALFEQMDPEFASGFIARMRPEAAALVMAGLSSERAYAISAILAGRNSSVPKE